MIDEDLVDRRPGDLVDDLNLDVVVLDAEGWDPLAVRTAVGDDEPVRPQGRGGSSEDREGGQKG